jgi:hypothetical protein
MTKSKWIVLGVLCAQVLLCVVVCKTMLPSGSSGGTANQVLDASAPPSHMFGASPGPVGPFVPPLSWSQATWFVDPSNVSTCASDNNLTCSLSTCGTSGDGPCLSYGSIVSRWGTTSPRIRQNTIITAMSSNTSDADVWYAGPFSLENSAGIEIAGTLTPIQTTTITVVAAKNRNTPQLLEVTFAAADAASLSPGLLVINTTHPSRGWTYKIVSGTTWLMSQTASAIVETTPELRNCANPTEQDVWTTGDTVTINALPQINLSYVGAVTQGESSSTFSNGLVLYNVGARLPTSTSGFAPLVVGGWTMFVESSSAIPVYPVQSGSLGAIGSGFLNSAMAGGILASLGASVNTTAETQGILNPLLCMSAGYFGTSTTYNLTPTGAQITQDAILAPGFHQLVNFIYGGIESVYLDTSTLTVMGRADITGLLGAAGGPFVWGTGAVSATGNGRIFYPAGGGAAATTFLQTGGVNINGKAIACTSIPADAAPPSCSATVSVAAFDTDLGANSGCVFNPGGGAFCNYGP